MTHIVPAAATALNNLIEAYRDGYFAHQEAATHLHTEALRNYCHLVSQERTRFGCELLQEVFKADTELGSCGLNVGERPLPWRIVKGHFIGQDELFILTELEKLENWTQQILDALLATELAPDLRTLVDRQLIECCRVRDYVGGQRIKLALADKSKDQKPRPSLRTGLL